MLCAEVTEGNVQGQVLEGCSFHFGLLDACSRGTPLSCCKRSRAAPWTGLSGEEHRPLANSQSPLASHASEALEANPRTAVGPSDDAAPADSFLQPPQSPEPEPSSQAAPKFLATQGSRINEHR